MNKIASIQLTSEFFVRFILTLCVIFMFISFFTKFLSFVVNQPVIGQIMFVLGLIFLSGSIAWFLTESQVKF